MAKISKALRKLLAKCTEEGASPKSNSVGDILDCIAEHYAGGGGGGGKVYRHFVNCAHKSEDFGDMTIAFELYSSSNTPITSIATIPEAYKNKPILCVNNTEDASYSKNLIPQKITFGTQANLKCLEIQIDASTPSYPRANILYATNCDEDTITFTDTVTEI